MRIDIKPVLISILMIVFDLSTGVGAQIQNFEVENIPEIDDFNIEIPELMCGNFVCEKKDRSPSYTPIDGGNPVQEFGWWYNYWNDYDNNGMDDDLQLIIDGQKDSQSTTSIVGVDGRNTVAIIIHYAWHPGQTDIDKVKSTLEKYGWEEETSWFMPMEILDNIVLDHVPVSSLIELWSLDGVVLIEEQNVLVPFLDKATKGSKVRPSSLYAETMRELNYDGSGIVIAILDTGVDNEHFSLDDFSDNNNDNTNDPNDLEDPKWVAGCDATSFSANSCTADGGNDPDDGDGHGTHVAGIALGTGDSDRVNQGYAPGAYLVDVKVMTDAGGSNSQSILQGIQWATQNVDTDWGNNDSSEGIDIMSMSFGSASSPTGNDDAGDNGTSAEAQAVNQAADAGIVCIAAIGNDGQRRVTSVGSADKAITIGAIDDRNSIDRTDDSIASYSNSGPRVSDNDDDTLDELKPWVVAPGSGIISAEHAQSTSIIPGSENNRAKDDYTSKDGTSMSTPAVAGLVAIMLQIGINEGLMEDKDPENTEKIMQYLMQYSENRGTTSTQIDGNSWNTQYGFGIIDGSLIMKGMFGDGDGGGNPPIGNETGPGEGSGNWVEIENPVDGECEYDPDNTNTLVCKSWVIEGETYRIRGNIDQGDNNGTVDDVLAQISYKYKPKNNQPTREEILIGWHTPETITTGDSITNWSTTIEIPEFTEDEIDALQVIVRVAAQSEFGQWSNVSRATYGIGVIDFVLESPSGQNELSGTVDIQGRYQSVNGCTVQWRIGTDDWENAITIGGNGYSYSTQDSDGRRITKTGIIKDSGDWSFSWDSSTIADGTHRISVRMISGNGVMSEEIRKQIIVDNIPPSPDLMFRSSALSFEEFGVPISEVYVNTFLEIRGSIRNIGDVAANEVGIILEEDGARRDEYIIPKIDSGEIVEITLYWNPTSSGERQIEIIIDPVNSIEESDETNNRLSESFPVIPRPDGVDLAIRDSAIKTIPEIPRPDEQVVLEVRVDNLGSDDAFDVDALFEIKTDKGWTQVASNEISRVFGQGSTQVSFLYVPNMSGVLDIRIDISGQFADLDWSNNIFETSLLIDESTLTGPRNLNFKEGEVPVEVIDLEDGGIIITQRESSLHLYKLTQSKNIVQCNNIMEEMWSGEINVEIDEDNIAHLSWTRRYLDNNGYYKQTLTYSTIDSSCQMTPIQDLMPPILLSDGKYWGIDMDQRGTEVIISGYHQDIFTGGSFQERTDIFLLYSDLPISSSDWSITSNIITDIDISSSSSDSLEIEFGVDEEIHLLYQENRDDTTGIERLGLWYAHGELDEGNWAFKKAIGDQAALAQMTVITEKEDEKIVSCWREGNLDDSEIVCIIADSSFRAIGEQMKSFPARGLRNIDFVESERGIQVYYDGVGPTGPQLQYGLINFEDGWLGISDRLGNGQLHTSTKSPSSTETLILHSSSNGWQIRSLIDDEFGRDSDISSLDWLKIQLGLSNNDQEFRILVIGVSVTVLILCAIIIVTMSTQGMKWISEKRKTRLKNSVKLEEDVIDIIGENDLMVSSAEIDMIELIPDNNVIDNKESRRMRRFSRMEKDQNIKEDAVFPVKVIEDQKIENPLVNNNQIMCPFCNSKFGINIGISSIKCPVCQERIDL